MDQVNSLIHDYLVIPTPLFENTIPYLLLCLFASPVLYISLEHQVLVPKL
jgi:hypothetical protein